MKKKLKSLHKNNTYYQKCITSEQISYFIHIQKKNKDAKKPTNATFDFVITEPSPHVKSAINGLLLLTGTLFHCASCCMGIGLTVVIWRLVIVFRAAKLVLMERAWIINCSKVDDAAVFFLFSAWAVLMAAEGQLRFCYLFGYGQFKAV